VERKAQDRNENFRSSVLFGVPASASSVFGSSSQQASGRGSKTGWFGGCGDTGTFSSLGGQTSAAESTYENPFGGSSSVFNGAPAASFSAPTDSLQRESIAMDEFSEEENTIRKTEDEELSVLTTDVSEAEQMLEVVQRMLKAAHRRLGFRRQEIAKRRQSGQRRHRLKRSNVTSEKEASVEDESAASKIRRTSLREDDGETCEAKTVVKSEIESLNATDGELGVKKRDE